MKLAWPCPKCGVTLRAEPRHAGKHTKCPKCQTEVVVPMILVEEEPAEAPAPTPTKPAATPAKPVVAQPAKPAAAAAKSQTNAPSVAKAVSAAPAKSAPAKPAAAKPAVAKPIVAKAIPAKLAPTELVAEPVPDDEADEPAANGDADYSAYDFTAPDPDPDPVPVAQESVEEEPETDEPATDEPAEQPAAADNDEDFFSSFSTKTATKHAPAKAIEPLHSVKRKKSNQINPAIWIAAACVAGVALVGAGLYFGGAFGNGSSADTPQIRTDGPAFLVIDWPREQRIGGRVIIDGAPPVIIADSGPIQYQITPGSHQIKLQRGLEEITMSVNPKQSGERCNVQWKSPSLSQEAMAETSSAPGGGAGFPTEKLVLDAVPALKKWDTDVDAAKQKAAAAKKDLFIVFFGADRRDWCFNLASKILTAPDFQKFMGDNFVPVVLEAKSDMFDEGTARGNVAKQYHVKSCPTIILADPSGWAYASQSYLDAKPTDYVRKFRDAIALRQSRDEKATALDRGSDEEKLTAAVDVIKWLKEKDLLQLSTDRIKAWQELADRADPKNEKGQNEIVFLIPWQQELKSIFEGAAANRVQALHAAAETFEHWKKDRTLREPNGIARMFIMIAMELGQTGDESGVSKFLGLAKSCGPTDPRLQRYLDGIVGEGGMTISSGSGFAVSDDGYIVTNNHVVKGPGDVWVRIAGEPKELPADVVITDPKNDIALIHLKKQPKEPLKPLPVAGDTLGRGVEVAVFGFPLGDELGGGVKLTKGIVTALPDKARENMYLLDVNVNHGNSGGPLCDRYGRVVGLVSARTIGNEETASYGMALPTPIVFDFIKPKLPSLTPGEKKGPKLDDWSEVDKVVSPSVVMILKKK